MSNQEQFNREVQETGNEWTFSESTIKQWLNDPVTIELFRMWEAKEKLYLSLLANPKIDDLKDIMYFKGCFSEIEWHKNLPFILQTTEGD